MSCRTGAHLCLTWVYRPTPGVPHGCAFHPFKLPKTPLCAPKTAHGKHGLLPMLWPFASKGKTFNQVSEVFCLFRWCHKEPRIGLLECKHCLNRSEEHTSELQSRFDLVCRLLLEKKKKKKTKKTNKKSDE